MCERVSRGVRVYTGNVNVEMSRRLLARRRGVCSCKVHGKVGQMTMETLVTLGLGQGGLSGLSAHAPHAECWISVKRADRELNQGS